MKTKFVFGLVVLTSIGIIYGVHYQHEQERLFMRRRILREIAEQNELAKLKRNNKGVE